MWGKPWSCTSGWTSWYQVKLNEGFGHRSDEGGDEGGCQVE